MIKQAPFTNAGTSGIKHIDSASRHKRKQEDITYNYIIFHNEDIKITAYNESGNWSMTEGWQPYTDPEANFSLIGQHAQTWQKYADRAFIGRDDGLPRAELDDSQFFVFPKGLRNRRATKMGVHAFIETKLLDTIKGLYEEPSSGLENNRERLKYEFDNPRLGLYIDADAVLDYYNATPSFNEEDAKAFIRAVKPYNLKKNGVKALRMSDVMHAPELYEAYPVLADMYVIFAEEGKRKSDAYVRDNTIYINETKNNRDADLRKALLHEAQHVIQKIEGMVRGGNSKDAYEIFRKTFASLRAQARRGGVLQTPAELKQKLEAFEAIDKNYLGHRNILERWLYKNSSIETDSPYYTNYDLYKRLAGEIEARNVERRADWTQAQRDAIPFNDTLDISADEAIVIQEILNYKQSQEQQGTADYSLFSGQLQTWQRDPVAELGELGRFGSNIMGKLTPVGHDAYDQRISNMREVLSRRLKELRHIWQETEEDGTAKSPDTASRVVGTRESCKLKVGS